MVIICWVGVLDGSLLWMWLGIIGRLVCCWCSVLVIVWWYLLLW